MPEWWPIKEPRIHTYLRDRLVSCCMKGSMDPRSGVTGADREGMLVGLDSPALGGEPDVAIV